MADTYYDYNVDPRNNDTPDYIRVQSTYYSGAFDNRTAPSSANFPLATPTKYYLTMPGIIDVSDLAGTRPIAIRDVTSGVTLTRVSGAPGANEYFVPPATSERRNMIELNAAQAGNEIGFDFYMIGSILSAEERTTFKSQTYIDNGDVSSKNFVPYFSKYANIGSTSGTYKFCGLQNSIAAVVYDSGGTTYLRCWNLNLSTYYGTFLNIDTLGTPSDIEICRLSDTTIALISNSTDELVKYTWTPGSVTTAVFAQTGNKTAVSPSTQIQIVALGENRVAIGQGIGPAASIDVYDFDGSDWAKVGNSLTSPLSPNYYITVAASADYGTIQYGVTVVTGALNVVSTWLFDGTNWAILDSGVTTLLSDFGYTDATTVLIESVSYNTIAVTASASNKIEFFQRPDDQDAWVKVGQGIIHDLTSTSIFMKALDSSKIIYHDTSSNTPRLFEIIWTKAIVPLG